MKAKNVDPKVKASKWLTKYFSEYGFFGTKDIDPLSDIRTPIIKHNANKTTNPI